jgi:2,5-diketo-D-gluconate reductase A
MITLNDGRQMPALGMGTWQLGTSQAAQVVRTGIDVGFKLVDTAAIYANERQVGEGIKGSEVWLTTKLWNDRHRDPEAALDESLALLGLEAVDLYLIHWPSPALGQYVDAWRSLVGLREAGKALSIGVSNFLPEHLDAIVQATGVTPAVNQIELHPRWQQRELVAYHQAHGIVTQSWSPLAPNTDLLSEPAITRAAEAHSASPVRVVLAWHLAKSYSVIPKASGREHLTDNFAAMDLSLTADEIAAIDALDSPDGRTGADPATSPFS